MLKFGLWHQYNSLKTGWYGYALQEDTWCLVLYRMIVKSYFKKYFVNGVLLFIDSHWHMKKKIVFLINVMLILDLRLPSCWFVLVSNRPWFNWAFPLIFSHKNNKLIKSYILMLINLLPNMFMFHLYYYFFIRIR